MGGVTQDVGTNHGHESGGRLWAHALARAAPGPHRDRRSRILPVVAAAVLVAGLVGSVLASSLVASNAANDARRAFEESAHGVASTLQLAISHEQDLIVASSGFVASNPDASNAEFVQWANSIQAFERYPELLAFGYAVVVPAADVAEHAARVAADAPASLGPGGSLQILPPGDRPFYCLATVGQVRSGDIVRPAGLDYCAVFPGLLATRDSGQAAYAPFASGAQSALALEIPVYRGGVAPAAAEARTEAFLGWVGMSVVPGVLLDRALQHHPETEVIFRFQSDASDATFQSGTAPRDARTLTISLHNGWTVEVLGAVAAGGIFRTGTALAVLVVGIVVSVLLGGWVFLLATTRARAIRLVEEKTRELQHQALHDALTGLPNRALILDRIEQLLARNRRGACDGAALYIDLDEFKDVNDTLGHAVGDRLLQAVAARLTASLREADTIGRIGGDEFVVLLDGASLEAAPELVAERLLDVMRQPFEIAGTAAPMVITTSVGIAIGARDEPGDLLRDADVALYQAKAAGKNCYEVFHAQMEAMIQHRYELEFDLRSALQADEFRLVYQPIYNLEDLSLVGVEALIRWDHPTRGEIQPDDFVPLLESSGKIVAVGRWVLLEACRQMASWRAQGSDLTVSVNVSGRQLDRDEIIDDVRDALQASGLDPASLTLEVTETALMRNVEATARRLRELKGLGLQIAVDDFGTGYSSLEYVQKFPVDCLKIDRTFTASIERSSESDALIRTLVQLGKDLGLTTLAEGVETTTQIDHLRGQHVDHAQGFLFAKPLKPESLETRLLDPVRPDKATSAPDPGAG